MVEEYEEDKLVENVDDDERLYRAEMRVSRKCDTAAAKSKTYPSLAKIGALADISTTEKKLKMWTSKTSHSRVHPYIYLTDIPLSLCLLAMSLASAMFAPPAG